MKKTFVTFGSDHKHTINGDKFDHNCVAIVNGDRDEVFRIFGARFCFEYPEEHWGGDPARVASFWPDGCKIVRQCTNCQHVNKDCTDCNEKTLDKWVHYHDDNNS